MADAPLYEGQTLLDVVSSASRQGLKAALLYQAGPTTALTSALPTVKFMQTI